MPKKKNTTPAGPETARGDIVQRRPPANATIGSVDTLEAEAKDRIERVMNALAKNRRNCRRKRLPNLRLKYPSEDELRRIAEHATVNDVSFGQHIQSIILDAHLDDASFRTLSIPQVRKALKDVASKATRLGCLLGKLDVGRESRASENHAGWLIEQELALRQLATGGMALIPGYIDLLDELKQRRSTISTTAGRTEQRRSSSKREADAERIGWQSCLRPFY